VVRCHHLFAEMLAAIAALARRVIPTLHRRARDWFAQNGYPHDAIEHALAVADFTWVAALIEREYRALVARGELVTLRQWLACLPPAVVEARPTTCLAYAWALAYPGRFDELAHYLARAGAGGEATRRRPGSKSDVRAVCVSAAAVYHGSNWRGSLWSWPRPKTGCCRPWPGRQLAMPSVCSVRRPRRARRLRRC
jgi:ATP/maltotriose-dependent transcriptional regulator MalT